MVVFVSQQSDVQVLMSVLDDFNKLSSAKINWAKSGSCINRGLETVSFFPSSWVSMEERRFLNIWGFF